MLYAEIYILLFIPQIAMNDTFLLSNILPQDIDNNGGFWNRFEIYCREHLPEHFREVRVISGPLFLPSEAGEDDKKFVKYQVCIRGSKLL